MVHVLDNGFMEMARNLKKAGIYGYMDVVEESDGASGVVDGKRVIVLGANDYLGLSQHPKVIEAGVSALRKYGTSVTGSRLLNGTRDIHLQLERELAKFLGKESAVLFSAGMLANIGAIPAICLQMDTVFSDKENHASIIQGTRLSGSKVSCYEHSDMSDLEKKLQAASGKRNLIVSDGVFSMTGATANVSDIMKLAGAHDAWTYFDDAHGIGVLGEHGRGTVNEAGLTKYVDFIMGTLSKTLASQGGFIAGSRENIAYIMHQAPSFIFTAALSPVLAAMALAALEIIQTSDEYRLRLWENIRYMRTGLDDIGLYIHPSQTSIMSIHVGDFKSALVLRKFLLGQGVWTTSVQAPAVPSGYELIRMSFAANHTMDQLDSVLEALRAAVVRFPWLRDVSAPLA